MKLFLILFFVNGLDILTAAPTTNHLETYIKSKCPIVKDNAEFFQDQTFNKCSSANVTIISDGEYLKNELNEQNSNDLLCALFLNNFLSLCEKLQHVSTTDQVNLKPEPSSDIFIICNSLINTSLIFKNKLMCLKFCIGDKGNVLPQCILAHYYANYEVKSTVKQNDSDVINPILPPVPGISNQIHDETPEAAGNKNPNISVDSKQNGTLDGQVNPVVQGSKVPGKSAVISTMMQSINTNSSANYTIASPIHNQKNTVSSDLESEGQNPAPPIQTNVNVHVPATDTGDKHQSKVQSNVPVADTGNKPQQKAQSNVPTADTGDNLQPKVQSSIPTADTSIKLQKNVQSDTTFETAPTGAKSLKTEKVDQMVTVKKVTPAGDGDNIPDIPMPDETPVKNQDDADPNDIDKKSDFGEPDEENNGQVEDDDDNTNTNADQGKDQIDIVNEPKQEKPEKIEEDVAVSASNIEDIDGESYFFSYFMVVCVLFVLGYIFYHNRTKVMALVLEGKRSKRQYRGRRPNSANYHKLDSNLEEAISSSCSKNSSNIIY